jgi:hypothetical protein
MGYETYPEGVHKHVMPKLKSTYIATIIFSYMYFIKDINYIALLSKAGHRYLKTNKE